MISATTSGTFNSFTSTYPESVNVGVDNGWNRTTPLGQEFKWAETYFRDKMGMTANEAYQNAYAYILNKYTGTTLSKYNSSTQKFESTRPIKVIKVKKDSITNQNVPDTVMQLRSGC